MLHEISDIHERISQGDEKIFKLYKEMGANLFTNYTKHDLQANLLYTVFRMDSPDFYLSLKEKTLSEYLDGKRNYSFYDQMINRLNIYCRGSKKRITNLFELCTHTKNVWNLEEVINIYSEAQKENVDITSNNKLDKNEILLNMVENLYGYTFSPLWMWKKNDYDFEENDEITLYEKNMLLYVEKMLDFLNPTLIDMIDEKIFEETHNQRNALRRLLTIDNEKGNFHIASLILKKYNININHDEVVKTLPDLRFEVQMHYFNNGLDLNNPKPLIKYDNQLMTIKDFISALLEKCINDERDYPDDITTEMREKKIIYEKLLLKKDIKLITANNINEKLKNRL